MDQHLVLYLYLIYQVLLYPILHYEVAMFSFGFLTVFHAFLPKSEPPDKRLCLYHFPLVSHKLLLIHEMILCTEQLKGDWFWGLGDGPAEVTQ